MKRILVVGLCLLAGGCTPPKLKKTLPPDVRVDTYAQQSASKIDVLWVVDDSGSMAPRQENLAKNFQSFIDVFSKGAIDFRIAVTTTDIFKNRGQLKGSPKILTPKTSGLVAAFQSNVKVGILGSPYEAGLQAALMAIELQNEANAPKQATLETCLAVCKGAQACIDTCNLGNTFDFLRTDAYLYLIFVTDEEDESAEDIRYYWRSFETAKGLGNDGTVTTAAIMGDVPTNGCGATPGTRYKALSDLTGGEVGSICDTNFSATLKKLATNAVGLKRKFAIARKPNITTIEVAVRYPCNTLDEIVRSCASVDRTECIDNPPESLNLVCKPPQGGPDGWSYEPATQVIFFAGESVPFLKGLVEIQYYEEGMGPG
ncbi:MAG: Cell surface protein precursor [Myxococcaceae bacterium]|nr:Cell surface protein precursor [Myxococcaceae bacterium]